MDSGVDSGADSGMDSGVDSGVDTRRESLRIRKCCFSIGFTAISMLRGSSNTPEEHPTRVAEDQKMLFFHWFYSDFNAEQNGDTPEKQPRNNRDITREITRRGSLERLFYLFFYYFPILTILIFEPLLEPLQLKTVRE